MGHEYNEVPYVVEYGDAHHVLQEDLRGSLSGFEERFPVHG